MTLTGYGVFRFAMGTPSPLVVVTSNSMYPELERGYLLVLQSQAPEDIHVGEIIVYNADWHASAPVVHRVIQRDYIDGEYRYYTQGDNNDNPDPYYRTYDDIVGVVIADIPWIGNITLFLQQPGVLPVVIVLLIVLMIIPEFLPKKEDEEAKASTSEPDETDAPNA
jgi:signal peptidase